MKPWERDWSQQQESSSTSVTVEEGGQAQRKPWERDWASSAATAPIQEDSWTDIGIKTAQNIPEYFEESIGGALQAQGSAPRRAIETGDRMGLRGISPATQPDDGESGGVLDYLADKAKSTFAGISAAGGVIRDPASIIALGQTALSPDTERERLADVQEKGDKIFKQARAEIERNAPVVEDASGKYYSAAILRAVFEMGPAMATTYLTRNPQIGAAVIGSQVYGRSYAQAKADGRNDAEAHQDAMFYMATEGLSEAIPLGVLTKPGSGMVKRIFKGAAAEFAQEVINEAAQMGYDMGILDKDVSAKEALRRLWDAGIIGAGAGGTLAVITQPAQSYVERRDAEKQKVPVEDLQKQVNQQAIKRRHDLLKPDENAEPTIMGIAFANAMRDKAKRDAEDQADNGIDYTPADLPVKQEQPLGLVPKEQVGVPSTEFQYEGGIPFPEAPKQEVPVPDLTVESARDADRRVAQDKRLADQAQETKDIKLPEGFNDPRLKRLGHRFHLQRMASETTRGGDVAYVTDEHDRITGRTPSINPKWFQEIAANEKVTVDALRNTVNKALNGEKLGVRQARIVSQMLDEITEERTNPGNIAYVKSELEKARKLRNTLPPEMARDYDQYAGEIFEENEYDLEWDGEARAMYELAEEAYELGGDQDQIESILGNGQITDTQTAKQLITYLGELRAQQTETKQAEREQPAERPEEIPGQPDESAQPEKTQPAEASQDEQVDLFGGKSATKQAIYDREVARQKKEREAPGILEGDGDLFAGPRPKQTDIETTKPVETGSKSVVDQQANEAATSPKNKLPEPTEAQKEAGNYKKGHVSINGLDISIENPAGSKRRPEWPALKHHYGYIKGTVGKDKDHIDVFLGPKAEDASMPVFVVDQINPKTGKFDEHKVMLGFKNKLAAKKGYLDNYAKGWKGIGAVKQFSQDEFKAWLESGNTTKPVEFKEKKTLADVIKKETGVDINKKESKVDRLEKQLTLAEKQRTARVKKGRTKGGGAGAFNRDIDRINQKIDLKKQQIEEEKAKSSNTKTEESKLESAINEAKRLGEESPYGDITAMSSAALKKMGGKYDGYDMDRVTQAVHDGQYEAIRKIGESLPVPIRESDISKQLAEDAFKGTSHTPDKRAKSFIRGYVREMVDAWQSVESKLKTEEIRDRVTDVFHDFRDRYTSLLRDYLSSHGRVMSSFIVGPAKFPTQRNQKRSDAADKKMTTAYDYYNKSLKRLKRAVTGPTDEKASSQLEQAQAKLKNLEESHAIMKAVNKVIREKNFKNLDKNEQIEKIQEAGLSKKHAEQILVPSYMGNIGFESYVLTNNNAEIRRMRQRVAELQEKDNQSKLAEADESTLGAKRILPFEGGQVEIDYDNNRVRIVHDEKPDADVRANLKQNGFRWSPSNTAWQRKITDNAIAVTERITGVDISSETDTDAKFSRRTKSDVDKRISAYISEDVDRITKKWKGGPKINVVQTERDLPEYLYSQVRKKGAEGETEGLFDPESNSIYLVANNLPNSDVVQRVIFHEALGHYGLRSMFGSDLIPLLNKVALSYGNKGLQDIADRYGLDLKNKRDRQIAAEEKLAQIAESGEKPNLIKQLIALVRDWLRKHGFTIELSENDIKSMMARVAKNVTQGKDGQVMGKDGQRFSRSTPTFYSQMTRALVNKLPGSGTADQMAKTIEAFARKGEFKQEELEWSGVLEWLGEQEGKVTKDQVMDFVRNNEVQVQEVIKSGEVTPDAIEQAMEYVANKMNMTPDDVRKEYGYADGSDYIELAKEMGWVDSSDRVGDTKYSQYQLPGGENYKELLLTLPAKDTITVKPAKSPAGWGDTEGGDIGVERNGDTGADFRSGHFDEPNILAHIRLNERTDAEGKRVLFIEEVQSDWHQQGRKKGYGEPTKEEINTKIDELKAEGWEITPTVIDGHKPSDDPNNQGYKTHKYRAQWGPIERTEYGAWESLAKQKLLINKRPPDAPFKTSWPLLAMKRIIRYAAENGFDRVAWTTGEQQAERYDLSKQVDEIDITRRGENSFDIDIIKDGTVLGDIQPRGVTLSEVEETIGKDLANKAEKIEINKTGEFRGLDLKVGGEGMKGFYDKMLPSTVNKYVKKWGGKVGKSQISADGYIEDGEFIEEGFATTNYPVHSLDITDPMRESVMQGQAMFSRKPVGEILENISDSRIWNELVFKAQDRFHYLEKEQKKAGSVPESQDAYLAELRYHGMVGAAIEDFQEDHIDPLLKIISDNDLALEDVDQYLWARHAPEANAQLEKVNPDRDDNTALSGMSNEEAADIIDGFRRSGQLDALESVAQHVDMITKMRRDLLVSSGLEAKGTIDAWEKTYQYYVPLHRAGKGNKQPPKGKGFDIRGKEKRRAGSTRDVVNVLAHVVAQYESTLIRAEKVKVGKALLKFVEAHPNPDMYEVDKVEYKAAFNKDGLVTYRPDPGFVLADNVLNVRVNGVDHRITFNPDSHNAMRIAHAMKNLGPDHNGPIVNMLSMVTRWLALVNTGANPEFVISNFFRDIQTAGYNLSDTEADALKWQIIKDVGKAWRGIRSFQKKKHHAWARHFDEFRKAGAKTGWMTHYKDISARENNLAKQIRNMKDGRLLSVKRGLKAIEKFIEEENTAVENAIRLSAYVHARKSGISEAKAAKLAKELTVNFNRKGDLGAVMNALYLFYNASIQGSVRIIQAAHRSPKVRKLIGATIVFAAVLDMLNRGMGGDDDDGKPKYDKIPDFVKERNLIIMSPTGSGDYIKIPLPWGYNVFHVMGQTFGEAFTKKGFKTSEGAGRVVGATASAFNPLGSIDSVTQFVSPTITDPLVQWSENKDWSGRPLRPSDNPFDIDKPQSQKYWNSVREPSRWLTERLNELTGGDEIRPGAVDISPEALDLIIDTYTGGAGKFVTDMISTPIKALKGDPVESYEIPLLRKVYGKPGMGAVTQEYYKNLDSVKLAKKQFDHYRKKGDSEKVREIRNKYMDEIRMADRMKASIKAIRSMRKRIKHLEEKDSDNQEAIQEMRDRIAKEMTRFNAAYNKRVLKLEETGKN